MNYELESTDLEWFLSIRVQEQNKKLRIQLDTMMKNLSK